jgi:hypothetical protein
MAQVVECLPTKAQRPEFKPQDCQKKKSMSKAFYQAALGKNK